MRKKLLVCMMVLTIGFTGCGSDSGSASGTTAAGGDAQTGENNTSSQMEDSTTKKPDKDEKETNNYYGNQYREKYDVGLDTYIWNYCKCMITFKTANAGKKISGICGITDIHSMAAAEGIGQDNISYFNLNLSNGQTDEEFLEAIKPILFLRLESLHVPKTGYSVDAWIDNPQAEFKYDKVTSVEIKDYKFTKGTGQLVIYPISPEDGEEPYSMNMVVYARKLTDGNVFYYFEWNDSNIVVLDDDGYQKHVDLSIEDLTANAEKNLKTFKEYDCEYSDFNEGV